MLYYNLKRFTAPKRDSSGHNCSFFPTFFTDFDCYLVFGVVFEYERCGYASNAYGGPRGSSWVPKCCFSTWRITWKRLYKRSILYTESYIVWYIQGRISVASKSVLSFWILGNLVQQESLGPASFTCFSVFYWMSYFPSSITRPLHNLTWSNACSNIDVWTYFWKKNNR